MGKASPALTKPSLSRGCVLRYRSVVNQLQHLLCPVEHAHVEPSDLLRVIGVGVAGDVASAGWTYSRMGQRALDLSR
jgi:hypothetical protein